MQGSDLTTELLMTQALNDYNTKIINNTWGAPSDEQRQIIALYAELKLIKDNNIELYKTVLDKIKKKPGKLNVTDPSKLNEARALIR